MTVTPWGCFYGGEPPNGDGACIDVGFYAWRDLNQAISSGLETVIDWTMKLATENPSGIMSLATDTFTVPAGSAGRYTITSGIEMTIAARGSCYLRCYHNGVYNGSSSDEGSIATTLTPNYALIKYLAVGDTIQMRVFQNSGFAATIVGCCDQNWFSASSHCVG